MDDATLIQPENASVFACHAPAMRQQRLAVVPLGHDRRPHVTGFNRWRGLPSTRRVKEWAERFPDANVGILPGLCGPGATVLDCDTPDAAEEVQDRFGKTQLRTMTRRGKHLYFAGVDAKLPGNLRKFGLDVDIKTGRQIVIAPPSNHESGHVYRLEDADWSALDRLPALDLGALAELTGNKGNSFQKSPTRLPTVVTVGERHTTLNKLLVKLAFDCAHLDAFLDLAHAFNAEFAPPLEAAEVVEAAAKVWRDKAEGKIERWKGRTSMEKRSRSELRRLCELDAKRGPDAFGLLQVLRDEHSARCRRGETFQITAKSMAFSDVMPGWTRERYENARDLLIRGNLIERVQSFKRNSADGRRPALFKLVMVNMGAARGGGVERLH